MNQVCLIGRLTSSASLKYTQSGKAISTFAIAVNKVYKDNSGEKQESVSYFDISLFGRPAETLQQYLTKGKQVGISGELKQDRWEKNGQNYSRVYVVAENVMLLGGNQSHQSTETTQSSDIIQMPEFPKDIPF